MLFRIFSRWIVCIVLLTSCKSQKPIATKSEVLKPVVSKSVVAAPVAVKKSKSKTTRPAVTKKKKSPQKEKTVAVVQPDNSSADIVLKYISTYTTIAKDEMKEYGIPASITLAQGILESGAGEGELTQKANNHFGIKCHRGWTGRRVYHDDDEDQECFRKYKNPEISFRDHSLFLSQRSRYSGLFELSKDDYVGWAKGLRKAGYATDPKYPQKLIRIIEKYNLSDLDREVLGKKKRKNKKEKKKNKFATYTVKVGDTLYSISLKYNIDIGQLKKYNGLHSNEISVGQELLLDTRSD